MDKQRIIQYQSDFDKIAHFINIDFMLTHLCRLVFHNDMLLKSCI